MPHEINKWCCNVCDSAHIEKRGAAACENGHPKLEEMEIIGVTHRQPPQNLGFFLSNNNARHPTQITVRFSEDSGDFATYMFERSGPRGL